MEKGKEMTMRNVLKVIRYALCGAILAIAFVQGFIPNLDIDSVYAGGIGFLAAGLATAKALSVI